MSDNSHPMPQDAAEWLTVENIADYMEAKGAVRACPACNTLAWSIFAPARDGYPVRELTMPQRGDLAATIKPSRVQSVLLVCNNCSYLREHAAKPIALWVHAKHGQGGEA